MFNGFDLSSIGRLFLMLGGLFLLIGIAFFLLDAIPGLGRLPGDIIIKRERFVLIIPVTTMILLSIVLSLLLRLFR